MTTKERAIENAIIWGDPPPAKDGRPGVWLERLRPFMDRPGEWGQIPGNWSTGISNNVHHNTVKLGGRWEWTMRHDQATPKGKGRKYHLWVRYLGPDEEAS